jgi:hypothetical protein
MYSSDPTSFPLREGGSVPRDLVNPLADALARGHGLTVPLLAAGGGISAFELLMLLPPPEGVDVATHRRNVLDLTLSQALHQVSKEITAFHKRREAEAEAEMLKQMEEGGA